MLSDESPPTARVLSDDVSLARRERRLVSRKRLENLAPTSSCSTSASSEFSNCGRNRTIDSRIISEERPIRLQRAKHIWWGGFVPRLRACIESVATLFGRRWEIGTKQISRKGLIYAARNSF